MKRILLLEDDHDTSQWLTRLLKKAFGEVLISRAESIEQAHTLLEKNSFSIAIVDIYLPDGNGIHFIQSLKQDTPHMFCVIMTAYDDTNDIFSALKAGANGYLLKSQEKQSLIQQFRDIMNGAPPLSPSIARRIIKFFSDEKLAPAHGSASSLTQRENEVLLFIAKGMTRRETADLLGIRAGTVAGYIKQIYVKLDISSRAEAALEARRLGLV